MPKRLFFGLDEIFPEGSSEPEPPQNQRPSDPNLRCGRGWVMDIDKKSSIIKLYILGVIGDVVNYRKVLNVLYSLEQKYTVHVYIQSPGGSIRTGSLILAAMERCKATIITHNLGLAASCGSLILAFGDKICIHDNAITMFHHAGLGMMDYLHRMATSVAHANRNVLNLFTKMKERGILKEEEIEQIVNQGMEFYLTADDIRSRLKDSGLLYEEGEQ